MLKLGDTFLLPKPNNPTEHLWVVITERDLMTHEAVCVNISSTKSYTPKTDKTLELVAGEHPCITKPSVVYYKDARVMRLNEIDKMLAMKQQTIVCVQKQACSIALLEKIKENLPNSPAKPNIKERCKAAWEPQGKPKA